MTPERIILVTGANTGVGYEAVKSLLLDSPEYLILLGCRDISKGEAAAAQLNGLATKGKVVLVQIEVTDDASVDAAAVWVGKTYGRLDVLVNNAGICILDAPSSRDALRKILAVNVVGAVSVTEAFLSLMRRSKEPRLVFVSSSVGSLTHASDPSSRYYTPRAKEYRASKAALNMLMIQYNALLKDEFFKVLGVDPGLNATNLTGDVDSLIAGGAPPPSTGGTVIAAVTKGDRDDDTGRVYGANGVCPW